MKRLTLGTTGPIKLSSAKAVRALMRKRTSEGAIEQPDLAPADSTSAKVEVKLSAKVLAFLQRRNKSQA